MKKTLFFGVILMFSLLLTDTIYACSCRIQTPEQHFRNSSVVFVGEFREARSGFNQTTEAIFKVSGVLKGEIKAGNFLTVRTARHGPMCGISGWTNERPGASWVIYANPVQEHLRKDTLLATNKCSGTLPIH